MELALLGVSLCQLLLFVFVIIRLKLSISRINATLTEYFSPQPEDKPSLFAQSVEGISQILAKNIVASVKGYLLSLNSAEVRTAKAESRMQLQAANPLLGALMSTFPALGKKIIKNPEMAQLAFAALQNMGGRKEQDERSNGHSQENPFQI